MMVQQIVKLSTPSQQFLESALLWKCICLDLEMSVFSQLLSTDEGWMVWISICRVRA